MAGACNALPACSRFPVWGVSDRYTWRGAETLPLLLDVNYGEKPVYSAPFGRRSRRAADQAPVPVMVTWNGLSAGPPALSNVRTQERRRLLLLHVQLCPGLPAARRYTFPLPGRLAQLGERLLDKQEVTGSSPVPPIAGDALAALGVLARSPGPVE